MSQKIERLVRRQQALQESCSTAWVLFACMAPVAVLALAAVFFGIAAGSIISLSGLVSGVVAVCATSVTWQLFTEARRLGKILRDPARIMRSERSSDLVDGLHWSSLIPFSGWRD